MKHINLELHSANSTQSPSNAVFQVDLNFHVKYYKNPLSSHRRIPYQLISVEGTKNRIIFMNSIQVFNCHQNPMSFSHIIVFPKMCISSFKLRLYQMILANTLSCVYLDKNGQDIIIRPIRTYNLKISAQLCWSQSQQKGTGVGVTSLHHQVHRPIQTMPQSRIPQLEGKLSKNRFLL